MENKDFKDGFRHQNTRIEQIQPFFEQWLAPLRKPCISNSKGKILINSDYIRIPESTIRKNFNKNTAMFLSRSKVSNLLGLPNEFIGTYKVDTKRDSESLVSKATLIFSKLQDHPAFGNPVFIKTFIDRIPKIVEALGTVFNLFGKLQVSIVIVGTTEDIISRSLSIVASTFGIPCICLQHGLIMGEEAYMPAFASVMAVYGEYEEKWYKERGLTDDRIALTGHPRYDIIFTEKHLPKQSFMEQYKVDPYKLTLLIPTSPRLDLKKFKRLIALVTANPKFQIMIKPHPWELAKGKCNFYLQLKAQYKTIEVITNRSTNTYDLLSNVDGVLTSISTTALEGLLFNKPVFIYDFFISNRSYDYYEGFGQFIQSDPDLLVKIINNYYSDPKERRSFNIMKNQFLEQTYKVKKAGSSLSNLIYEIVNVK